MSFGHPKPPPHYNAWPNPAAGAHHDYHHGWAGWYPHWGPQNYYHPPPPPAASGYHHQQGHTVPPPQAAKSSTPRVPLNAQDGPRLRQLLAGDVDMVPMNVADMFQKHVKDLMERQPEPAPIEAVYVPKDATSSVEHAEGETDSGSASAANGEHKEDEVARDGPPPPKRRQLNSGDVAALNIDPDVEQGRNACIEFLLRRQLEAAKEGDNLELTVNQINFSQESIKGVFIDKRHCKQMMQELQNGEKTVGDIPPITVVMHDGEIYSADNRRLWVFKECGMPHSTRIPVVAGKADAPFMRKLTTPSGGASVRRRQEGEGFH